MISGDEDGDDDDDGTFLGCNMIKNNKPGINSNVPYRYHQYGSPPASAPTADAVDSTTVRAKLNVLAANTSKQIVVQKINRIANAEFCFFCAEPSPRSNNPGNNKLNNLGQKYNPVPNNVA